MTFVSRVTKYSLLLALAFVLAFAATPSAKADTMSLYNVSGVYSNGWALSGQISVNSWGIVTNYALNLTGASNTATCSGTCTFPVGTFSMGSGSALLSGWLLPGNSIVSLTYGNWFNLKTVTTSLTWSAVSVPEEPALLQGLLVFLTLGLFLRKDRLVSFKT